MLINSGYPLDLNMKGGITALIIGASEKAAYETCIHMIEMGADVNKVSDLSESALSQAVHGENMKLV